MSSITDLIQHYKGGSGSGDWAHRGRPGQVGGSGGGGGLTTLGLKPNSKIEERKAASKKTPKKKVIIKKKPEKKSSEKAMDDFEKSILNEKIEHSAVYDADGKELFRIKGKEGEVTFSDDQLRQMKNAVVTHNHPSTINGVTYPDGGSFSDSDISLMIKTGAKEVRAVTENYTYIARPRIVNNINLTGGTALNLAKKERQKIKSALIEDVKKGKITNKEATVEMTHKTWEKIADAGFIEYERIPR